MSNHENKHLRKNDEMYKISRHSIVRNLSFCIYQSTEPLSTVVPYWLISPFDFHCLDSTLSLVSESENFNPLACFCSRTGWFVSDLAVNPDYRITRNEHQVHVLLRQKSVSS